MEIAHRTEKKDQEIGGQILKVQKPANLADLPKRMAELDYEEQQSEDKERSAAQDGDLDIQDPVWLLEADKVVGGELGEEADRA